MSSTSHSTVPPRPTRCASTVSVPAATLMSTHASRDLGSILANLDQRISRYARSMARDTASRCTRGSDSKPRARTPAVEAPPPWRCASAARDAPRARALGRRFDLLRRRLGGASGAASRSSQSSSPHPEPPPSSNPPPSRPISRAACTNCSPRAPGLRAPRTSASTPRRRIRARSRRRRRLARRRCRRSGAPPRRNPPRRN